VSDTSSRNGNGTTSTSSTDAPAVSTPGAAGVASRHVVVCGGGIAGIAAALHLLRRDPDVRVTLLEGSERLGGCIVTERRDGFVLEGGPDVFVGSKPAGVALAESLGLGDRIIGTSPKVRGSYLLTRGRLLRLPEGLTGLVPTRMLPFALTPLLSPLGKLRVALDFLVPPRKDDADESVESFVSRRLGREMYERIVEPLLSGIWAGDGAKLSVLATFPHMRAAERQHGGMARAMLVAKREARARAAAAKTAPAAKPARTGFLSFPTGLAELVEAAERALRAEPRVELRLHAPVRSLARAGDGWRLTTAEGLTIDADAVILAMPGRHAAALVDTVDATAAEALRGIPYISSATVNLAYRVADVPRPLDASGWTTPRRERRRILACTWSSSKFEGRAPEGMALFRAFVGSAADQSLVVQDDAALVDAARAELREVLGVTAAPVLVKVTRWMESMPQYDLGHLERVRAVDARLAALPGLELAGSAVRGVGIPDSIAGGERAAVRILSGVAVGNGR
jgi:oxygen-dependent protoporphyrinogen oxidase